MSKTGSNSSTQSTPVQRAAILDDQEIQAEHSAFMLNQETDANIHVYTNREELAEDYRKQDFDAYILDHDLNGDTCSADVVNSILDSEDTERPEETTFFILSGSKRGEVEAELERQDVTRYVDEIYSKHDDPYPEIAERLE
ncbi:hypothetical protein [Candidatus Nanohalobium constans]|uniref:Response regulator n=1 Tax=Candidatus Nanohalobium constans TaxID=2565781 RepID=A0A5Q0UGS8_9ARCH|nr:hypothetical protein [Candidatus Nanohalobium constans]QGA80852.1 hypothetical protein LC1Nh_0971 [Candidatus Nanohalobium constans]